MTQPLIVRRRAVESTVLHMLGIALVFTAAGMAASLAVDLLASADEVEALAVSTAATGAAGGALWWATRVPPRVSRASALAAVSWTWIGVAAFGTLPYVVSGLLPALDDALFESISGFTVTGSSILAPIEGNSAGILFWRQLTQWYGGMGMIVLAVAVLPFLGVGGMELIRAEAPGETSDRLAPRVSETAKRLWLLYAALTVLTAVALLLTGAMAPGGGGIGRAVYDAVSHALTAVATGGFSPYNASVAAFDSHIVELVLIVSMVLGATSFTLHWKAVRGEPGAYWRSSEFRLYLGILGGAIAFIAFVNVADGARAARALRDASFTVVSIMTTTGFATADYVQWVPAAQLLLLFLMVSGGMVGSTSGAMKLFRVQIMGKFAWREVRRAHHVRGVLPIKRDRGAIPEPIVARVAGFVLLYVVIAILGVLALASLGENVPTSTGAVVSAMGAIGPGLDEVGPVSNFLPVSRPGRGVLMLLMLLGRLEIFPMLLMFAGLTRRARRTGHRGRPTSRHVPAASG